LPTVHKLEAGTWFEWGGAIYIKRSSSEAYNAITLTSGTASQFGWNARPDRILGKPGRDDIVVEEDK